MSHYDLLMKIKNLNKSNKIVNIVQYFLTDRKET